MVYQCPVCRALSVSMRKDTPYHTCPSCDLWFQQPLPKKTFEASHEKTSDGHSIGELDMNDHNKMVNNELAKSLFTDWLHSKPAKILDVGAKYPYLAHCFKNLGCEAYGMDCIEETEDFGKALGVTMLYADFEAISDQQIKDWTHTDKFDLITMVHLFEHMYDPVKALKKAKALLADDGLLFLRLPDHSVPGFERDLTPGHYTIHPYYHSLSSILEILVQGKDLFTIADTTFLSGAGQRDIVLRPLQKKPTIYAGLIVKNEERDLPRCLKSIESIVDGVVVVDTGSTDKTLEVAVKTIKKPVLTSTYTGASRQDENGEWKLWDFAKARNVFVEKVDALADYCLWMDADDELLTPQNLKRAIYLDKYTVFGIMMDTGQRWVHHRLWKTGRGIRFEGRIHEYPSYGGHPTMELQDSVVRHDATPTGIGEGANDRNLRILLEEFAEAPNTRNAFYLANTYKDRGVPEEAIKIYDKRITMGVGYWDEWMFAYLYKVRCHKQINDLVGAERTCLEALSHAPNWSEFWMELAFLYSNQGRYDESIAMSLMAGSQTPSPTALWREQNMYTDQPLRLLSFLYESKGELNASLKYAIAAKEAIGKPDKEWDQRISRLLNPQEKIAFLRPGAIGDILMTLNLIPEFKKKHPKAILHYFCHPSYGEALSTLMKDAGIDEVRSSLNFNAEIGNYSKTINLVGYPLQDGYPEKSMTKHLLSYFAKEMGLEEQGEQPSLEVKTLPSLNLPNGPYITLHPQAGWSVYKNWLPERWTEVINQLDYPVYQIGTTGDLRIPGANYDYMGTSIMEVVALMSNAICHMGVDSFTNHATHFHFSGRESIPSVILWGSTQSDASGYSHNVNIQKNLSCQPCFKEDPKMSQMSRGACSNPSGQTYEIPKHECMNQISVEEVIGAVKAVISKRG